MPIKVKNVLFETCLRTSRTVSEIILVSAKQRLAVDLYSKFNIVKLAPSGIEISSVNCSNVSLVNELLLSKLNDTIVSYWTSPIVSFNRLRW